MVQQASSRASAATSANQLRWKGLPFLGLVLASLYGQAGCSRAYYRVQADQQSYSLIEEKGTQPRWARPGFSVYPDVRSRYYDPYDPDFPPMPPDDPESHRFMHEVYGMKGSQRWHDYGDRPHLENPRWKEYLEQFLPRDEEGNYILTLDGALQVAFINSREYQRALEDIYLSALDVAFERFRFDTQFFGGNVTAFFTRGRLHPLAFGNQSSSQLSTQTFLGRGRTRTPGAVAGIQKLLPTGGQLLADFANSFVWEFAGEDRNLTARSSLSFAFLQPLLRAGGRDVVLERLTLAERVLLANLRQMRRYEDRFVTDLYFGAGTGPRPQRRGGFLGGAGLTGFTGLGTGGFGGVGEATGFGRVGAFVGGAAAAGGAAGAGFAAGVAVNVGGYYGLVQRIQQIRNRESNLQAQFDNLARVEALFEAGRIDRLQVDQFRQNVQSARSQYLDALASYERTLENFLTSSLGLPPDLPVRVDERELKPFQFIAPELTALQREVRQYLDTVREAEKPDAEQLRAWAQQFRQLRTRLSEHLSLVGQDLGRVDAVREQRLKEIRTEEERQEFVEQLQALNDRYRELQQRLASTEPYADEVQKLIEQGELETAHNRLVSHTDVLSLMLLDLPLVQAGARLEVLVVKPVRITSDRALRVAMANRLDIMNQRAELVDQWRLIAFNADDLQSDLDIEFGGEINTVDRNIARFRGKAGELTAALRFDAPLTRLGERNEYRQALIDYQRVRRDYIALVDSVNASLRDLLRRIEQFEQEMELRRRAMRIAIRTVDLTQEQLRQPPRVQEGQLPTGLGPTAVRDLLAAFSDLLNTQNDVMGTYLNYEALRMQLYVELGVAKFDPNGRWVDEPLEDALYGVPEMDPYVPPLCPQGFYVEPPAEAFHVTAGRVPPPSQHREKWKFHPCNRCQLGYPHWNDSGEGWAVAPLQSVPPAKEPSQAPGSSGNDTQAQPPSHTSTADPKPAEGSLEVVGPLLPATYAASSTPLPLVGRRYEASQPDGKEPSSAQRCCKGVLAIPEAAGDSSQGQGVQKTAGGSPMPSHAAWEAHSDRSAPGKASVRRAVCPVCGRPETHARVTSSATP